MVDTTIKLLLLRGKDLLSDEAEVLKSLLCKERLSGLKTVAKEFRICFTGATRKQEMIDSLMCMVHIWSLQLDEMTDSEDACATYIIPY